MKIHYDDAVDAVTPHGAVEFTDGINMDTTSDGHIAGIEIPGKSIRESVPCIHDISSTQVWMRVAAISIGKATFRQPGPA